MELKSGDVKDFLQDINRFLADTLKTEHLSSKAKTERELLLQRLSSLLEPSGPYIDMSGSIRSSQSGEYVALNTNQEKNFDSKLYEEFPDHQILSNSEPQECRPNINIEHLILPASKVRMVGQKFGALSRKERFMGLFVERSIRCYVGLVGHYLYVYNSDKDLKPTTFIHIEGFEARPAVAYFPKDTKKRDFGFEVVCPGKKSYQFSARSLHEMEQWITCINEAGSKINGNQESEEPPTKLPPKPKRLLTPPPSLDGSEEYDDIRGNSDGISEKNEEYGDDIYYNIKDLGLLKEEPTVPLLPQHCEPRKQSDCDLVYDDICPMNPGLYYNLNDERTKKTLDSAKIAKDTFDYDDDKITKDKFGYDDEDIYDDIGVLLNNSDEKKHCNGVDSSNNRPNVVQKTDAVSTNTKKAVFSVVITHVTESVRDSVNCADNVYEPVENPRDD